jgi:hypothetical protein
MVPSAENVATLYDEWTQLCTVEYVWVIWCLLCLTGKKSRIRNTEQDVFLKEPRYGMVRRDSLKSGEYFTNWTTLTNSFCYDRFMLFYYLEKGAASCPVAGDQNV